MKITIRLVSVLAVLVVLLAGISGAMTYAQTYAQLSDGGITTAPVGNFFYVNAADLCLGVPLILTAGILAPVDAFRSRRKVWTAILLLTLVLGGLGYGELSQYAAGLSQLSIPLPGGEFGSQNVPTTREGVIVFSLVLFVPIIIPLAPLVYSFWPATRKLQLEQPPAPGASERDDATKTP